MKKETLKEIGKTFLNLGNIITGTSIINIFFNHKIQQPIITILIYIIIGAYITGSILIEKGADNDK